MPLSDLKIKKLEPKEKPYMVGDDRGLYLEVLPNGAEYWRIRLWEHGREKKRSLGVYPDVTLAQARTKRDVGSDWDAYIVALSFVENRLVSPKSAEFPAKSQISIRNDDWNRWVVTGYVDSQNGFGALIRTKYQAVLRYVGNGEYRLEGLDFWK